MAGDSARRASGHAAAAGPGVCGLTLWGTAARRVLTAPEGATVIAVFERSLYLENGRGLACLGPPAIGPGPLNAVCADATDWAALGVTAGVRARRDGDIVRLGAGPAFSIAGAVRWYPPAPPESWDAGTIARNLEALAAAARLGAPAAGFGRLIPDLACGAGAPTGGGEADPFFAAGRIGAAALVTWLADALGAGRRVPPNAAEGLIGLGPGLTPAGDDLVGGAMVALGAVAKPVLGRLARWALPLARRRTGKISAAHLAAAAAGEGAEALHRAIAALTRPGAPGLGAALTAIGGIGHSSGWDALTGVAAVLGVLARR